MRVQAVLTRSYNGKSAIRFRDADTCEDVEPEVVLAALASGAGDVMSVSISQVDRKIDMPSDAWRDYYVDIPDRVIRPAREVGL
jgi:hypothetical protein